MLDGQAPGPAPEIRGTIAQVLSAASVGWIVSAVAGVCVALGPVFHDRFGTSPAVLAGSFAAYFLCASAALLLLGTLSDFVGRRLGALVALGLAVVSCGMFILFDGDTVLVLGRSVQGLAVGVSMSSAGSFVVDLGGERYPRLVGLVASAMPPVGVATGSLATGALIEHSPARIDAPFWVFGVLVLVCGVAVLRCPETAPLQAGWRPTFNRPAVPRSILTVFVGACLCFVACWSLGGLFLSLGASFARDIFAIDNTVAGACVAAMVVGCTPVGGLVAGKVDGVRAAKAGMVTLAAGTGLIAASVPIGSFALFLVGSVMGGLGFGASLAGYTLRLLAAIRPAENAGVLAGLYLFGFLGSSVPVVGAGIVGSLWDLRAGLITACAVIACLALAAFRLIGRDGPLAVRD